MTHRGKTALITGASGGIGYELSKLFAADGFNIVLVARSEQKLTLLAEKLRETHGVEVTVLAKDLSTPEAPRELYTILQEQSITIDALVNNAGFGTHGPFAEIALEEELNMLQLNVVALTYLTKLFLPGMLQRNFGYIMNIASTGAFQPCPLMGAYCATKSYVLHLTEAIAEEVRGTGVIVNALCPGATRTGFQARADAEDIRLLHGPLMTAEKVAEMGYRGLMRGKRVVVPGLFNQALAFSSRITPRTIVTRIGRWIMEPVKR
ncbi:MAG: SDR family oxidoreductase [Anaerolineae bacterium]|nr:SDR family oxidoreductase [Anaerolineae bacterium]